ncbi:MAG: hypothetical protein IJF94_03080 [Eubacterium sp.]|nr:hypothetical protein [Eubacterium sp.]
MSRLIKNIITVALIIAVGAGVVVTFIFATMDNAPKMKMQPNGPQQNAAGNTGEQPPAMPNDQNAKSGSDNKQQPPQMNDQNGKNHMKGMPSHMKERPSKGITVPFIVALVFETLLLVALILFLILSKANEKTIRETFTDKKRIAIFLVALVVATAGLGIGTYLLANNIKHMQKPCVEMNGNGPQGQGGPEMNNQQSNTQAKGVKEVKNKTTLSGNFSSKKSDVNAILTKSGGTLTLNDAKVRKTGDASAVEQSDFSGTNAAILTTKNSTSTIKNTTITTNCKGGNAVFATGSKAKVLISDSTIKTTGQASSRGLDATYGGYIEANNVTISTKGGSCATLATDRGEGTVKVSDSNLTTNGAGSPIIYSTGDISLTDSEGTANGSQITVVEGKNTASIKNSNVVASGAGNRGTTDIAGVMIYQSMSGDADQGTGVFNASDSTLSIQKNSKYYKSAPFFFITNTDAVINLANTKISYGSGTLIDAKGTDQWGTSGNNAGNFTLNAKNQTLTGDIKADKISTGVISLANATYTGTINGKNTAKKVTLKLDKSSKIKLTGDSYVTSFSNADKTNSNIDFNGHTLYVNGKAIKNVVK